MLREDLAAERHPADGGGRAFLEPAPDDRREPRAGEPGRWTLVYEAGPQGVAAGGAIYLQVPPYWDWSTPQVVEPDAPGYTTVTSEAAGVELEARTLDFSLLGIEVRGRALAAGERVRIVYGAGEAGAHADRFAERGSRLAIAVDGDGDGIRALVAEAPEVTVRPGPPARLVLHLPSSARPGDTVPLTVAVLDALGNAGVAFAGAIAFEAAPGLALPERVALDPGEGGATRVDVVVQEAGVHRVRARGPDGLVAESNPLVVTPDGPRLLWGDLHGHSNLSDGTGTPEDYFRYARDVAALDVAALTDHDHWGLPFLDQSPALWRRIVAAVARFHQPERFVALLGFEWTSWIHGHRHVLYFDGHGEIVSSIDSRSDSPLELWEALRGRPALTFAHHPAGGPVATNWAIAPDPRFEPVVEIASVHGSSEALDGPLPIYSPVPGHFARDALARGYRLGFVGSGDGHDGHPGLAHLAAASGGLAGLWSESRTREGVLEALRARRVYATNGPRIWLRATLDGLAMGSALAPPQTDARLLVRAATATPAERVDVVRSGRVVASWPGEGRRELFFEAGVPELAAGETLYVRVVQQDGGAAWSSPFFLVAPGTEALRPPSGTGR